MKHVHCTLHAHVFSDVARSVKSHSWRTFTVEVISFPSEYLRPLLGASAYCRQVVDQQSSQRMLSEVRIWSTVIFPSSDWVFKVFCYLTGGSWAAHLAAHSPGVLKGTTPSFE